MPAAKAHVSITCIEQLARLLADRGRTATVQWPCCCRSLGSGPGPCRPGALITDLACDYLGTEQVLPGDLAGRRGNGQRALGGSAYPGACRRRVKLTLECRDEFLPLAIRVSVQPSREERRELLSVEDWAEIRRLHLAERLPIKAIARLRGVLRNTVQVAIASDAAPKYTRRPAGSIS